MRKIFGVYAANGPDSSVELDLPATDYEMLDLAERLHLQPGEIPYLEVQEFHDFDYLESRMQTLPDIYRLNGLAKRLNELDSQGAAAFEGLVGMASRRGERELSINILLDYAHSADCCHVIEGPSTDYQLGRFLAEAGEVPEAKDLSGTAFELLDFGKIGREHRLKEDGIFTSLGYVSQQAELQQIGQTMDFQPREPPYTILLNTMSLPLVPGQKQDPIPIRLPTTSGQLQETLEKLGCTSWSNVMVSILDCPVPSWNHTIFLDEEIPQVFKLAEKLRQLDADGNLTKYKAILAATDCQEVADAVALAEAVDEYTLLPNIHSLEAAAKDDLSISIDPLTLERLLPYVDLRNYGVAMLDYYNAKLTSYGRLDRGGEPIQLMGSEPEQGGMEMMQ